MEIDPIDAQPFIDGMELAFEFLGRLFAPLGGFVPVILGFLFLLVAISVVIRLIRRRPASSEQQ